MKLLELFNEVKDENLPQERLEVLRDEMIHLHTEMQLQMANLEKLEANFIASKTELESDVARKREWRITKEGQRMIEINRYIKAVVKEIDSLKSRVYRKLI